MAEEIYTREVFTIFFQIKMNPSIKKITASPQRKPAVIKPFTSVSDFIPD